MGLRPARAGTSSARRWPRRRSGRCSRSTAAGSTSSSRTTRTSWRSRARSATSSRSSGCTTACSRSPGEKMSKSLGNDVSLRNVLDAWGREAVLMFFLSAHWRKPVDFTDESLAQAKAQVETFRNFFLDGEEGEEDGEAILVDELAAVLDDDFNTPEALALFHDWRAREEAASLRWGLGLFGLGSVADAAAASAGGRGARRAADRSPRAQGLRRGRPAPRRDRRGRLGGPRRARGRLPARPRAGEPRAGLRAAAGPGGAARPPRGARAVGDRAGGQVGGVASRGREAARPGQARPRSERRRRHARPPGRARLVRAVPLRGRVRAGRRRAAAARLPRPGQRPAQSRRRLPQRRGSRRDRASSFPRTAPRA